MKETPPTTPPLTLFDAAQFEFEMHAGMKAPARPPVRPLRPDRPATVFDTQRVAADADADAAKARRRRSRARLAKRRYLADSDGYERMERARRALQLVGD